MEESKRHARLGMFVVVTLSALVAVLFALGGRTLFQPVFIFETYFDESVAGLEIGAPVRFRGVPLGRVTEILTSAATYERDAPMDRRRAYIVVRAKVDFSAEEADQLKREAVQMVKRGLRVQTHLAGITGQQYLSIDILDPARYPPLEFEWTPKYPYLPSAPSLTGEIISNAQSFIAHLSEADIKSLSANLNALVVNLDRKIGDVPVAELAANVDQLLRTANSTFARIDRIIAAAPIDQTLTKLDSSATRIDALLADPALKQSVDNVAAISGRLRKLADDGDLDRVVKRVGDAAERLDALIGENQYDARVIVQDLRVTADNLRVLSESLKRQPAGILWGGPPDQVQLPNHSP
jgi:phospholipid/cholesterol/gamma-HCH transport system substrate-binding protein/paraquat-inducible protein B